MLNRKLIAKELRKAADELEKSSQALEINFSIPESYENIQNYSGKAIIKYGINTECEFEVKNLSYNPSLDLFFGDSLKVITGSFKRSDTDHYKNEIKLCDFMYVSGRFLGITFSNCSNLNINQCFNSKFHDCKNITIEKCGNIELKECSRISIAELFGNDKLHFTNCEDIECKFTLDENNSSDIYFYKCGGKLTVPEQFDASFRKCNFQEDNSTFSSFEEFLNTELPKCKNVTIDKNNPDLNGCVFTMQDWKSIKPKYLQAIADLWNSDKDRFGFEDDEEITPELLMDKQWELEHSVDGYAPYSEWVKPSDKYVFIKLVDSNEVNSFSTEEDLEESEWKWEYKNNWR